MKNKSRTEPKVAMTSNRKLAIIILSLICIMIVASIIIALVITLG